MSADATSIRAVIADFLGRAGKPANDLEPSVAIFGEGLGLDSLEAAELSAMLEDEFGSDPFSAGGALPETVGDVLKFYGVDAA